MVATTNNTDKNVQGGYTAVIYFHGMGSQRRYEETSRLIDAIDRFLSRSYRKFEESKGRLSRIKPRLEPSRNDGDDTVTYIRTLFDEKQDGTWGPKSQIRFYEVYWAPIMSDSSSAKRVLQWMFSQVMRPWQTIRSPWRERQRLRRAVFVDLLGRQHLWPDGVEKRDFSKLGRLYNDFEGWNALREYPTGRFRDFIAFIENRLEKKPNTQQRCIRLARTWFNRYRRRELTNAFYLITLALALLLTAGTAVALILLLLQLIADWPIFAEPTNPLLKNIAAKLNPTWTTASGIGISFFILFGFSRFLTDYMGDVESWSTYEETDKKHERRQKVIDIGDAMIKHVLADPQCKRVVLVSHSLGTTVAYDTLLQVARNNRAHNSEDPITGPVELMKISHFVTLASPIDKIQYFFESYKSQYHRYKRVVEELRGDIGRVPFSRNNKPYIHWVNFWDEGDIISGALQSPTNRKHFGPANQVDNVHVSNLYFPAPGESHSAYFLHHGVINHLFEIIYKGKHDYKHVKLIENKGYDYKSALLGPGDPTGAARPYFYAAILVPWLALAGGLMLLLEWNRTSMLAFGSSALLMTGLIISYIISRIRGPRNPN